MPGLGLGLGVQKLLGKLKSFLPSNIDGLQLWLDATDLSTITKDGSDFVSVWNDKSDNNYSFIQGTASNQPKYFSSGFGTNSKPYLLFDGINDHLADTIASNTDWTIISVMKKNNVGTLAVSLAGSTLDSYSYFDFTNGNIYAKNRNGFDTVIGSGDDTNEVIGTATASGTDIKIYKNSSLLSSSYTSFASTGNFLYIGRRGTDYSDSNIAEVIMYNRVLTANELTQVHNYLNSKYGIY